MAMRVSKSNSFALTVSADHLVGRYDLKARIVTFGLGQSILIITTGRVCDSGKGLQNKASREWLYSYS